METFEQVIAQSLKNNKRVLLCGERHYDSLLPGLIEILPKMKDIENKNIIDELASSAPIDHDKVSSIKKAISSGNYPLDLDKISDALMDAYNDMKS